jgi:hypothetical protein
VEESRMRFDAVAIAGEKLEYFRDAFGSRRPDAFGEGRRI